MKRLVRNAHVGIATGFALLVVGFWPVHSSEAATGALGITAFFVGIGVFVGLSMRDERAARKRPPRSP
jgi:hypothetical protein